MFRGGHAGAIRVRINTVELNKWARIVRNLGESNTLFLRTWNGGAAKRFATPPFYLRTRSYDK